MADKRPLVVIGNDIGQIATGDTVPVLHGGTGSTTAAGARTNLGATTVGANIFTASNPSAVRFLRVNADNTITWRSAAQFASDIGAASGSNYVLKAGDTMTGTLTVPRLIVNPESTGRQLGIIQWADLSQNDNGFALFGNNTYYQGGDNTYRYTNTHGSLGARGLVLRPFVGEVDGLAFFDTGSVATTTGVAFTPTLLRVFHEGNFTPGNYLPLAGGNMTGQLYINSAYSLYGYGGNGGSEQGFIGGWDNTGLWRQWNTGADHSVFVEAQLSYSGALKIDHSANGRIFDLSNAGNLRVPQVSIGGDTDILLYEGAANQLNIRTGPASAYKYFGFQASGSFSAPGLLWADVESGEAVRVGNDASLWDVNVQHVLGVKSQSDNARGGIKFGDGPVIQRQSASMLDLDGGLQASGGEAYLGFQDRGGSAYWGWYSQGGVARLYHNGVTGDQLWTSNKDLYVGRSIETGAAGAGGILTVRGQTYAHGWLRTQNSGEGWYHEVHGGGWHMTDNNWIRNYNNKGVLISGGPDGRQLHLEGASVSLQVYDTDRSTYSWIHYNDGQFGFLAENSFSWAAYRTPGNDWGCVGNLIAYASDRRLKTKIENVSRAHVENFFDKFVVRQFHWDLKAIDRLNPGFNPRTLQEVGAITQEVSEHTPEMVLTHPATGIETLDWDVATPYLISEMQALRARVKELEKMYDKSRTH